MSVGKVDEAISAKTLPSQGADHYREPGVGFADALSTIATYLADWAPAHHTAAGLAAAVGALRHILFDLTAFSVHVAPLLPSASAWRSANNVLCVAPPSAGDPTAGFDLAQRNPDSEGSPRMDYSLLCADSRHQPPARLVKPDADVASCLHYITQRIKRIRTKIQPRHAGAARSRTLHRTPDDALDQRRIRRTLAAVSGNHLGCLELGCGGQMAPLRHQTARRMRTSWPALNNA